MTLNESVEFFLQACEYEQNLSKRTLIAYSLDLRQFCKLANRLRVKDLPGVTADALRQYVSELIHSVHLQDSSIRRKLAVLRRFFNFLEQRGTITVTPFRKAQFSFRQGSKIPRVLSRHEITAVLTSVKNSLTQQTLQELNSDYISQKTFVSLRDNALLELLFYTGARVGEIVGLNIGDCNLACGFAILKGKGRRERLVHLQCAPVIESLKLYLQARKKMKTTATALFLSVHGARLSVYSVESRVAKYSVDAGIATKITPHAFRHTMATMLLENGADIRTVQEILGHSSIRTTQIYTHISSEQKRRAMGEYHPRNLFRV